MAGSALTAFNYVAEGSECTPGLFNAFLSILSSNIAEANSLGNVLSNISTVGMVTINANSNATDYLRFHDTSGQRSDYLIGSFNTGTADGLNIYDVSGATMIVSFSKQSIRFFQNVVGPVFDTGGALAATYNAATFIGSGSTLSAIQAAINQASIDNVPRVYLPASMYPYSASSISFIHTVRMVREGGNWSLFDVLAYGANGLNVTSDTSAFAAALSGASVIAGTVFVPSPTSAYKMTKTITIPRNVAVVGESKHATRIANSIGTNMIELGFGAALERLWIDGNGSNFSGTGIRIYAGDGKQTVRSCQITNFSDYCIEFVNEASGSQSLWEDLELGQSAGTLVGQEAVSIRGSLTAAANPRTFIAIQTQGLRFAAFGPCNNLQVVGSRIGDCLWDVNSRGVVMSSCRIAGVAPPPNMTILGANHAIVGCHIAPRLVAGAGLAQTVFRGNNYDNPIILDQAFDGSNVLETQKSTVSFPFVLLSDGSTLPDVSQGNFFQAGNTSATTITNFANGYNGQQFALRMDSNTGIAHNNSNIRLSESMSIQAGTILPNEIIEFTRISGIWFEQSRSWAQPYFKTFSGNFGMPEMAFSSEISLGWLRSANSSMAISYGTLDLTRALASLGTSAMTTGTAINPSLAFTSEGSLGLFRSAASSIAQSYGTLTVPGPIVSGATGIATGRLEARHSGGEMIRLRSDRGSASGRNWGIYVNQVAEGDLLFIPSATNTGDPQTAAGAVVFALSTGSVRLNQSRLLSVRTLAASSVTATAVNTNVQATEMVFTIGGASGASLIIHSGGTAYGFNSAFSAAVA